MQNIYLYIMYIYIEGKTAMADNIYFFIVGIYFTQTTLKYKI